MLYIWFGWDYFVFVFCLCLLVCGYKLLGLVSIFMFVYFFIFVLFYFEFVIFFIVFVEVLIVLLICLMVCEVILCNWNVRKVVMIVSLGVVVLFGLIYGLGFVSVLGELGVL